MAAFNAARSAHQVAGATPAPSWFGKQAHAAELHKLLTTYYSVCDRVDMAEGVYAEAVTNRKAAVVDAEAAEAARQAHATKHAKYLEVIAEVRTLVAGSPRAANRGADALLGEAAERHQIALLDWHDLWNIPHPTYVPTP